MLSPSEVSTNAISPATASSPKLPGELCDAVMDELGHWETLNIHGVTEWYTGSQALKQCALVCREWRPRAQFWLFCYPSLNNGESLWGFESTLDLRAEYLTGIYGIRVYCQKSEGYPVHSLPTAVTALARRCPNLRALYVDGIVDNQWDEYALCTHVSFPFHLRLHSALFRQSFRNFTILILHSIHYHSDTDFLAFVFSFTALEELVVQDVTCRSLQRVQGSDYIALYKKRKGVLKKLRSLRMISMQLDVFSAIVEILSHDCLHSFEFGWPFVDMERTSSGNPSRSIDISRFTALSNMKVYLDMKYSGDWIKECQGLSSFMKLTPGTARHLSLVIVSSPLQTTRKNAMEAFQNVADIIGADREKSTGVVLNVVMHGLPLSEQSSVHPITGEIRKLFPERMHVNFHTSCNDEGGAWSWKPENSETATNTACDEPVFPMTRGRRHSFPPPSSYNFKNTARWAISLPDKNYTHGVHFQNKWQLARGDRILPDGQEFQPPRRDGERRHDFSNSGGYWVRQKIVRRMSGGFESLVADTASVRDPAFITPYPLRLPVDRLCQ